MNKKREKNIFVRIWQTIAYEVSRLVYVILLIPAMGTVAAAFRQAYLRKGFRTTMMCSGIALVLYEIISFLAALVLGVTRPGRFMVILGTAAMSLLSLPVLFLLVRGIAKIGGDSWKE